LSYRECERECELTIIRDECLTQKLSYVGRGVMKAKFWDSKFLSRQTRIWWIL